MRESEESFGEELKRRSTSRPIPIPIHPDAPRQIDLRKEESRPGYRPGVPPMSVIAAHGEPADLTREIETWLRPLSNHIWHSTDQVISRLGGVTHKSAYAQLEGLQPNLVLDENRPHPNRRHWSPSNPLHIPPPDRFPAADHWKWWLIPTGGEAEGPVMWRIRPAVKVAAAVLAHRANELLPSFALARGRIEVQVSDHSVTSGTRGFVRVTHAGRGLNQLPDGVARWVSIALRLAGRRLLESSVWLPAIWGDDKQLRHNMLVERYGEQPRGKDDQRFGLGGEALGVALMANKVLEGIETDSKVTKEGEGGLVFDIDDSDHCQTVLLVDEPEVHLHLDAQTEIREWLAERSREWPDLSIVVATHSPQFLDYLPNEARIATVDPWGSLGGSDAPEKTIMDISDDVVAGLEDNPEALGIATLDRYLLNRGFLLVEGPHDETVIRHFYGDRLDARRVQVVALWGTKREFSLTQARIFRYLGRPMALIVDNVENSYEKRELDRFEQACRIDGVKHFGDGHLAIDVIFTLPEEAVRRYLKSKNISGTFEGGWAEVQKNIPRKRPDGRFFNSTEKKRKAAELLGLDLPYGLGPPFIDGVIGKCGPDDRPAASLEDAMDRILSFFGEQ